MIGETQVYGVFGDIVNPNMQAGVHLIFRQILALTYFLYTEHRLETRDFWENRKLQSALAY
jgi:hypothetical protein